MDECIIKMIGILLRQRMCFEHSAINCRSMFAKNVPLYVFVSEHSFRVHLVEDSNEIVKARVEFPKVFRPQAMRFSPVRSPTVSNENALKSFEQFPVGNIETVWSTAMTSVRLDYKPQEISDSLVLHNSDPAGLLASTGTQPDVIHV